MDASGYIALGALIVAALSVVVSAWAVWYTWQDRAESRRARLVVVEGDRAYGFSVTNARRRVPLRSLVVDALREAGKIGPGVDPEALLFPTREGRMLDLHSSRRNDWNPAVENAGLDDRTPYSMRHAHAAHALAAGIGVFALARRMGTSVDMIDEPYGHLVADADDYERGLLDAYDERVSKTSAIEVEDVQTADVATMK